MSDLSTIHFRSFIIKREELRQDQEIKEYTAKIQALAVLLVSLEKIALVGKSVDEILKILHSSALKNKDYEAIGEVEMICKQISEALK